MTLIINYARMLHLILQETYIFGYLLASPHLSDSNKYPKHMFYEENKNITRPFLHIILLKKVFFFSFFFFYNSKSILLATSLRTNTTDVTRVHCILHSTTIYKDHAKRDTHIITKMNTMHIIMLPVSQHYFKTHHENKPI